MTAEKFFFLDPWEEIAVFVDLFSICLNPKENWGVFAFIDVTFERLSDP